MQFCIRELGRWVIEELGNREIGQLGERVIAQSEVTPTTVYPSTR